MKVYESPHPAIELPPLDLTTLLFESKHCAAKEDTKIHVEAGKPQNHITKAEARDVVKRVAHLLRNRYGIGANGPGKDVVLSCCSGNPFIPVLMYAIIAAGGVYSGAPTSFTTFAELSGQIEDAGAKVLMCCYERWALTMGAAKQSGIEPDHVLIIDHHKPPREWGLRIATTWKNILDLQNGPMLEWSRLTDAQTLADTTACLLYTSGTTGVRKGVRISHSNLVASTLCGTELVRKHMQDRPFTFSMLAHLPMDHVGGVTWSSLYPFCLGATVYWMEKYKFNMFIEYHRRHRPTAIWTVPPVWLGIANSTYVKDHFDSVQIAVTGAAPMGPWLAARATAKLGRGSITTLPSFWGSTETTGSMMGVGWERPDLTCSIGLPFPNMKIRLVDGEDNDVEPGQPGEMLVSGPVVCQGYHNRPEADSTSFVNNFYRTGDVALYKDGNLHIVDRLKDLIEYKGVKLHPWALETLLISQPDISDAAVASIEDESRATQVPKAFVVRRQGTRLLTEGIQKWVSENMGHHEWLRGGVVFVDEIPKSGSGKVLRRALRESVAVGEERDGAEEGESQQEDANVA